MQLGKTMFIPQNQTKILKNCKSNLGMKMFQIVLNRQHQKWLISYTGCARDNLIWICVIRRGQISIPAKV